MRWAGGQVSVLAAAATGLVVACTEPTSPGDAEHGTRLDGSVADNTGEQAMLTDAGKVGDPYTAASPDSGSTRGGAPGLNDFAVDSGAVAGGNSDRDSSGNEDDAGAGIDEDAGSTSAGGAGGSVESPDAGGVLDSPACEAAMGFVGQLTGPGSPVPNGGVFTTEPVSYGDANLAAVIDAYPASDAVHAIDVDVTGAVVTATAGHLPNAEVSGSRAEIWLADDNAFLKLTLSASDGPSCCPDFDVRAGMRISFIAKEVSLFAGLGHITEASDFVAGAEGSCISVAEPTDITDSDFYQMVRVTGTLGDDPYGDPSEGEFWQLGVSSTILYDFLGRSDGRMPGQVLTFVGPVSPYVGHRMLIESNPDWVSTQ